MPSLEGVLCIHGQGAGQLLYRLNNATTRGLAQGLGTRRQHAGCFLGNNTWLVSWAIPSAITQLHDDHSFHAGRQVLQDPILLLRQVRRLLVTKCHRIWLDEHLPTCCCVGRAASSRVLQERVVDPNGASALPAAL